MKSKFGTFFWCKIISKLVFVIPRWRVQYFTSFSVKYKKQAKYLPILPETTISHGY